MASLLLRLGAGASALGQDNPVPSAGSPLVAQPELPKAGENPTSVLPVPGAVPGWEWVRHLLPPSPGPCLRQCLQLAQALPALFPCQFLAVDTVALQKPLAGPATSAPQLRFPNSCEHPCGTQCLPVQTVCPRFCFCSRQPRVNSGWSFQHAQRSWAGESFICEWWVCAKSPLWAGVAPLGGCLSAGGHAAGSAPAAPGRNGGISVWDVHSRRDQGH